MPAPKLLPSLGVLAALALAPTTARAQAAPRAAAQGRHATGATRAGIDELQARLDRAVDRVSRPQPAALGREAARGYRLPGYGVVFVLAPRMLGELGAPNALQPRHRLELRRVRPGGRAAGDEVGELEREVIVLQQETEQARRAAEQDMDRIVRELQLRLAEPGVVHVDATADAAAAGDADPRPSAKPAVRLPPAAPEEAALPAPPPWKFWFAGPVPPETRATAEVVADVRQALIGTLEAGPGGLPGLAADEFVTVAVDFEAPDLFARRSRPERTLVVRARVRDLLARARGAIPPEELRRRIEAIEY